MGRKEKLMKKRQEIALKKAMGAVMIAERRLGKAVAKAQALFWTGQAFPSYDKKKRLYTEAYKRFKVKEGYARVDDLDAAKRRLAALG